MSVAVLIGGLDTVVNFLGFMMDFLAQHPAERRRLAANPDLIPIAVEEFVRRFPVVTIGRVVKQDVEFEGVTLKAGDMLMLPTVLHGLDDRENDEPMAVLFNRDVINHSTFGNGIHRCAGIHWRGVKSASPSRSGLVRIPEFEVPNTRSPSAAAGSGAHLSHFISHGRRRQTLATPDETIGSPFQYQYKGNAMDNAPANYANPSIGDQLASLLKRVQQLEDIEDIRRLRATMPVMPTGAGRSMAQPIWARWPTFSSKMESGTGGQ